ncbi:MAG: hypothetical protein ABSE89_09300 [Sedimentisphaerales bacterium]
MKNANQNHKIISVEFEKKKIKDRILLIADYADSIDFFNFYNATLAHKKGRFFNRPSL